VTCPSLRYTTVSLFGDMPTTRTEYICGLNTRSESRSCSGRSETTPPTNVRYEYGPLRAYIYNRDLSYRFELELATRIYTACQVNEYGSPKWMKPRQMERKAVGPDSSHPHGNDRHGGAQRNIPLYCSPRYHKEPSDA
jgi:hypothetical protein